jgi:hypothetical protein
MDIIEENDNQISNNQTSDNQTSDNQKRKRPAGSRTYDSPELKSDEKQPKQVNIELSYIKAILENRRNLSSQLQHKFNENLLVEKQTIPNYVDTYKIQNTDLKGLKHADPTKCFTIFWSNDELKYNHSKFMEDLKIIDDIYYYSWRDNPHSFGLSGELSIARLISYALQITIAFCKIDKIIKYFNADPNIKIIFEYFKNKSKTQIFEEVFKTQIPTREDLDEKEAKTLLLKMLIIIQNIKIIYDKIPQMNEDRVYLSDAYKFLTQIILTKSSLDSCQAEAITDIVNLKLNKEFEEAKGDAAIQQLQDIQQNQVSDNNFCLFNTYDFSAVVNTPHTPVMGAAKYDGVKGEFIFIIDNSAIFASVLILNYDINMDDDNFRMIKTTFEEHKINSLEDFINKFDKCLQIDNFYETLQDFGDTLTRISIPIPKRIYEKLSSKFLKFNVSKYNLKTENITKYSRDIRAHDYDGSPIRLFGIEFYIKKMILYRLNQTDINIIDDKKIIELLDNENIIEVIKFILEDESIKIQETFKNWNNINLSKQSKVPNLNNPDANKGLVRLLYMELYKKYYTDLALLYDPFKIYPEQIRILYFLMATEKAEEFENTQYVKLKHRMFVFDLNLLRRTGSTSENNFEDMVVLHCGKIFGKLKSESEYNSENLLKLKNQGYVIKTYELPVNTFGVVDLCQKRGGVNSVPGGILFESTATEADAAHASLGDYTNIVNISNNVDLYYNGFKCATVYSGKYIGEDQPQTFNYSRFTYFTLLFNLEKYNITEKNAKSTLEYLHKILTFEETTIIENDKIKVEINRHWKQLTKYGVIFQKKVINIYIYWLTQQISNISNENETTVNRLKAILNDFKEKVDNNVNTILEIEYEIKEINKIYNIDQVISLVQYKNYNDLKLLFIIILNNTKILCDKLKETYTDQGIFSAAGTTVTIHLNIHNLIKGFIESLNNFYNSVNTSNYVSVSDKIILEYTISEILRIIYYILNDDDDKYYGFIDIEEQKIKNKIAAEAKEVARLANKAADAAKKAAKNAKKGGGLQQIQNGGYGEIIIYNELSDVATLFGETEYGNHLTVENGKFVIKPIYTKEEYDYLNVLYGYKLPEENTSVAKDQYPKINNAEKTDQGQGLELKIGIPKLGTNEIQVFTSEKSTEKLNTDVSTDKQITDEGNKVKYNTKTTSIKREREDRVLDGDTNNSNAPQPNSKLSRSGSVEATKPMSYTIGTKENPQRTQEDKNKKRSHDNVKSNEMDIDNSESTNTGESNKFTKVFLNKGVPTNQSNTVFGGSNKTKKYKKEYKKKFTKYLKERVYKNKTKRKVINIKK